MKLLQTLSLSLILTLQGCWFFGNGAPADQIANGTYEIAGLIGEAQTAVRDSLKARALKPEPALAAATAIEKGLNLPLKHVLEQLVKKLEPSGGKEVLVITEADKSQLVSLINLFGNVAADIINDPSIVNLDSATHIAVVSAIMGIKPLVIQLAALLQRAPTNRAIAPPLRQQLRDAVQVGERTRTKNDKIFAEISAEAGR